MNLHMQKYKRAVLTIVITALVIMFILSIAIVFRNNQTETKSADMMDPPSVEFLDHQIPRVNCADIEHTIRQKFQFISELKNYLCYQKSIELNDETIQYVEVRLKQKYKESLWAKDTCETACMPPFEGEFELSNTGRFIVRENGDVENPTDSIEDRQ